MKVKLVSKETENGLEEVTDGTRTIPSPAAVDDDDNEIMTANDASLSPSGSPGNNNAPPPRRYPAEDSIHAKVAEQINSSLINVSGIDPHHTSNGDRTRASSSLSIRKVSDSDEIDLSEVKKELVEIERGSLNGANGATPSGSGDPFYE